jgi:hypothetical protein
MRFARGPYRFIQTRSRTFLVALKSDATAERSKDQFRSDFPGRSIFAFCNNIGHSATYRHAPLSAASVSATVILANEQRTVRRQPS